MKIENIAYACLTKHCIKGHGEVEALRWLTSDLAQESYTFNYFNTSSNKTSNVLNNLGIVESDVVCILLPRSAELITTFFAILKTKAIACILFSTLGEEAIYDRLENNQAKVIITKKSLARKITPILDKLPHLEKVLLVDEYTHQDDKFLSLPALTDSVHNDFNYPSSVDEETPAFLQYTSGSTGKPKGALHVHGGLTDMVRSFHEILGVHENDNFWCTADPAWITGLVYGIIVPFATLTRQVQFAGVYNAEKWVRILEEQKINVWYTAPTALRMLMQEETSIFQNFPLPYSFRIFSVGEPLNPEIYHWGKKTFRTDIFDTWFQSETGSIMIANRPGLPIKPGSMGIPRSGIQVLICDDKMDPVIDEKQGLLCLRSGWSSMFRTYYRRYESYREKFVGDIYITGDLARIDAEGYVWYISRADDVINTAGHLVGPFEVESALLEIAEVADVAVIGVDDPLIHKRIVAFVKLHNGLEWSRALELKCRLHVSNSVSTSAIPSEFQVIDRIPKNQSGKILRRVLKAIYEGKDPGDISTLE